MDCHRGPLHSYCLNGLTNDHVKICFMLAFFPNADIVNTSQLLILLVQEFFVFLAVIFLKASMPPAPIGFDTFFALSKLGAGAIL